MYFKMPKIAIFSIFLLLFYCFDLNAANLHAILVCDTHALSIGPSVEADYDNMVKCVKKIASYTGLKAKIASFQKEKAQANFMTKVNKLKIRPDDVVLFYWSGHGYHSRLQEDIWPILDFTYGETVLSQYEITNQLIEKKPRLLISIADCCNAYMDNRSWSIEKEPKEKASKANYKKLFLQSKGAYIASGCVVGEFSFGLNEDYEPWFAAGGFFTNAWLSSLYTATGVSNTNPSWEAVFDGALQQTIDYQLSDPDDPTVYQHPQYEKIGG